MKRIIYLTVLCTLGMHIDSAMAAGFVPIPGSGSAYVRCRTDSNFGFTSDTTIPPITDDQCVVLPGVGAAVALNVSPEAGFILQSSNVTAITAFSETFATLNERVFRNGSLNECIYAKHATLSSMTIHDYNPQLVGTQKMEVNDFAFGGYTGSVSVGYAKSISSASSVFRIGRTFTSVQTQADASNPALLAPGYLPLPTIGGSGEINGVGQTLIPPGSPISSQQQAPLSGSWVDFTVDVTAGVDEDGVTNSIAPNMYIRQACANATVSTVANSFKLRQTGQTTQPWVIVTSASRAPSINIAP